MSSRVTGSTTSTPLFGVVLDYVTLTKPRVMSLLLVTTFGGMALAYRGVPPGVLIAAVMVGGALASGGAGALNHWLERDTDPLMGRTQSRPVASGRISATSAFVFGVVLNLLAFAVLMTWANILAASLAMAGTVFYVLVYTYWLKRSTAQNIVIGGAAGAVPPLVGWASVTGGLALPAWYLFVIVFFWTPPHFWALAILLKDQYQAARIPMLPVVAGLSATRIQVLLYSFTVAALSILLWVSTDALGRVYLAGAIALGGVFVALAARLTITGTRSAAVDLYVYSLLYLAALVVFVVIDSGIG